MPQNRASISEMACSAVVLVASVITAGLYARMTRQRVDVVAAVTAAASGETLGVEFDFESVTRWRTLAADEPENHGLFAESDGDIRVVGAVHNVLALEGDVSLFDVYLQKGPEFLTFESGDFPGTPPRKGDGV